MESPHFFCEGGGGCKKIEVHMSYWSFEVKCNMYTTLPPPPHSPSPQPNRISQDFLDESAPSPLSKTMQRACCHPSFFFITMTIWAQNVYN